MPGTQQKLGMGGGIKAEHMILRFVLVTVSQINCVFLVWGGKAISRVWVSM